MIKTVSLAAVAAVAMIAGAADAATVIFKPGVYGPPTGYTLFADFDTPASQALVTGSNFIFTVGDTPGVAITVPGDTTPYLAVLGGGVGNISFGQEVRSFSFDYSTVDTYNTLTVNYADGGFDMLTGSDIIGAGNANGSTSGSFLINGDGRLIKGLSLASSGNSFEVDNLAISPALGTVPEPATWALMIFGFGLVGVSQRRRIRSIVTA